MVLLVLPATAGDLSTTSLALARRFHRGGTMWCVSPAWPHHAEHVAVEFVHPVIVGKRALPADVVQDHDPVAALRALVSPGDVIVALGPGVEELLRRAPAWGAETVWIGTGERPPAGAADHVLWVDDPVEVVLAYHLLWELTHVCFEHPGLLDLDPDTCDGEVCITCSDQAVLGEVIDDSLVRTAAGVIPVDTSLVGPVVRDQLVLVHAGLAIDALS
jgi:hypothetical protein